MSTSFDLVTFDTPSPRQAAVFWSAVLGLHESECEDGGRWIVLSDSIGVRRIGLQRGSVRPSSVRPSSVHLDLGCDVDEFDAEVARLCALGAHLASAARTEPYGRIANLVDPDGNLFDLCAYR
jgi:predicted enzyme related to lactoylglutathione lyase